MQSSPHTKYVHLPNSYNSNKQIDVDFVKPIAMLFSAAQSINYK